MMSLVAAAKVVPYRAYVRAIHSAAVTIEHAAPGSHEQRAALARLSTMKRVRLPDGRILRTDLHSIVSPTFLARPDAVRTAAHSIRLLDNALRTGHVRLASRSELAALDAILQQSRFHHAESLWDRVFTWILQHLPVLTVPAAGPGPLGWILTILALLLTLAAAGALALVISRYLGTRETRGRESVPGIDPMTMHSALALAREHEAKGEYRFALRYLLLGVLFHLRDASLLDVHGGATNRELLSSLVAGRRGSHDVAARIGQDLTILVDLFDNVWYGHQPLDSLQYARAARAASGILTPSVEVPAV